jgi:outer membrane protein assembly factor BamB
MKHTFYILLIAFLFTNCNKTISSDEPLPVKEIPTVLVGDDNAKMTAFNALTGNKLWEFNTKGAIKTTALVHNKVVYFGNDAGEFFALDIYTGKEKWHRKFNDSILSSACYGNNHIYFGCNNDSLYCLDLEGNTTWTYNMEGDVISSPLYHENRVYAGGNFTDNFHCIDATNGSFIWQQQWVTGVNLLLVSSPVIGDTGVFFGTNFGAVMAENITPPNYHYSKYIKNSNTVATYSSPLVYGGAVYFGINEEFIYSFDLLDGFQERWKVKTNGFIYSSAAVDPETETIYIGSYDFNLYAINHVDGTIRWKYPAGSIIKSSPVVYGKYVYFTSYDKYLYCIDKRNGTTVWKTYLGNTSMSSPIVYDNDEVYYPSISGMSK